jgi:hypothetical protein
MKEFFIPYNVPSSKNSRQWTGKYFVVSKTVQKWKALTKPVWIKYKDDFVKAIEGKELPLKIEMEFIRGSRHKFDYINPAQTIQDEMVHHGWLEDDNCTIMIPFFKEYSYNKEEPGVYIRILD